jgi:hypothetical protein
MKIDKVSIIIENVDEENASVRLVTDPIPAVDEEIEDTPAVVLGSQVWDLVQQFLEMDEGVDSHERTLQ